MSREPLKRRSSYPILPALVRGTVRKLVLLLVCFLFSALCFAACLSPTLPLPPPEVPDTISAPSGASTEWTMSGTCTRGAIVTVFNEQTGQGVVLEDRDQLGRYTVTLKASQCDLAWVKQDVGNETSIRETFVIEPRTPSSPSGPILCK